MTLDEILDFKKSSAARLAALALSSPSDAQGVSRMALVNRTAESIFPILIQHNSWEESAVLAHHGATLFVQIQTEIVDEAVRLIAENGEKK